MCYDAKRLGKIQMKFLVLTDSLRFFITEIHLMVHESDLRCEICNIPYTKRALEMHDRRFHPHLQTNELIEKALERNASAEVIYACRPYF